MKKSDVASLAFKLLALYTFIVAISMLQWVLAAVRAAQTQPNGLMITMLGIAIPFL